MKEIKRKTYEGVPWEIEERFNTVERRYVCGREDIDLFKKFPDGISSLVVRARRRSKIYKDGIWEIDLNLEEIGKK